MQGPDLPFSDYMHGMKYRGQNETFSESMNRQANHLSDGEEHYRAYRNIIMPQRFLAAGRVQSAAGSPREVTAFNCFVMGAIPDSFNGIMRIFTEAGETMRRGGGVGYDFSTIRPSGSRIVSMDTDASGPISFMEIGDAICKTIASAGNRRGAMMGVLRVDHPDIEAFVRAKQQPGVLTQYNVSVGVTDAFMVAVNNDDTFDLVFDGRVYKTVRARPLWEEIMRATWDWAEPGVLFIDRIQQMNNLWYCENIAATNPCAEQPLPPYGACLLGSFNLAKYVKPRDMISWGFDMDLLKADIPHVVRAMDNIIDRTMYPLEQQEEEAKAKRRMGLGVTGAANAIEAMGHPYGSDGFIRALDEILRVIKNETYKASALLAAEKGAFPMYQEDEYMAGKFIATLDAEVQDLISEHGIRNSHLTSIAPTGTISLCADNVSSGIEPVFSYEYERTVRLPEGERIFKMEDYGRRVFGIEGKQTTDCSLDDHINVLLASYKHVDSAVSKTCNVNPNMPWSDFKDAYMKAWKGGAKGCTTFNPGGKRMGILNAAPTSEENETKEGAACYIDPETGNKTCDE